MNVQPSDISETVQNQGKKRVMIVDDEKAILDVFRLSLEMGGYEVETYHKSPEALARIQEATAQDPGYFAGVLLDVHMPEINGCQFARKVYDMGVNVPILFVTGYTRAAEEHKPDNVLAILGKPVWGEDLTRAVEEHFR